jgi:hypothetical protein
MKERWNIIKRRKSWKFSKVLGIGNKAKFWLLSTCASKGVGRFESSYGAYCITLE